MDQPTTENNEHSKAPKNHFRFATLGVRLAAAFIDVLVYMPVAAFGVYNLATYKSFGLDLLVNLFPLFYKPLMEWKYGATLGKMALKVKVISTSSLNISLDQALARFTPFFLYLGVIIMSNYHLFTNSAFAEAADLEAVAELQQKSQFTGVSSFASFVMIFSVLYIITNPFRQGLHDKLARTYCIRQS